MSGLQHLMEASEHGLPFRILPIEVLAWDYVAELASVPRDRWGGAGLAVPTLVLHGEDDPLVPCEGGRDTAASAAPPGSGQLSHAWRTVSCCAGPQ